MKKRLLIRAILFPGMLVNVLAGVAVLSIISSGGFINIFFLPFYIFIAISGIAVYLTWKLPCSNPEQRRSGFRWLTVSAGIQTGLYIAATLIITPLVKSIQESGYLYIFFGLILSALLLTRLGWSRVGDVVYIFTLTVVTPVFGFIVVLMVSLVSSG